jgi:transient receptor potential cation channel subfamily M member 3
LATGLLDKCYKEDDELTSQLLTYDLTNWSHWTCLSLAVSANLKDFLSHAACQLLISDLWMGGMKIRKNITYKVITALLFPIAIFAIQFKSVKELQYMPQTQEEHEQDLESDTSSEQAELDESEADLAHGDVVKNLKDRGQYASIQLNENSNLESAASVDNDVNNYCKL